MVDFWDILPRFSNSYTSCQYSISIIPENKSKPDVLHYFQGVVEREQRPDTDE